MNLEINYFTKVTPSNEELELSLKDFISKNPKSFVYLSDSFLFADNSKNLEVSKNLKLKNYANDNQEIVLANFLSKYIYIVIGNCKCK
jgi:hypothetical protein